MSPALANRRGVIAGGNWIADRVKLIDTWPPQDALASILSESWSNGGSPYNVLKNLARLGAKFPLEAVGLLGDDADGRAILEDCSLHGIDTAQLQRTPEAGTSYTDVMTVQSSGRRTFFHKRGANALLDEPHFAWEKTAAKIFHLGYLLLLDRLDAPGAGGRARAAEVLAAARAAGLKTSVDVVSENSGRFASVVLPVLPEVDYFFANDFEAEKLTGIALRHEGRIHAAAVGQAARSLIRAGVREWVILHFPEAAYACNAAGAGLWQPSVRVAPEEIQGAAGAGDALASGVLLGLHDGLAMAECLRMGVCAGATALFHPTCSEGVLSLDECLALGSQRGYLPLPG